jgi:(4S)-4-hydroxy-5-phosphonooxypentane-2,3-dione isomerase
VLAIIIEFEVKPECRAAFEEKLRLDAAETLRDDGCMRMEILHPRGESHRLILSELWRDEAALAAHRNKPGHSHAWQEALIAGKRVTSAEVLPATVAKR